MQIHALEKNELIFAPEAEKKKDYACPECGGIVRLRSGESRKMHFYHLTKTEQCRLAQKGLIHLLLQLHLKKLLPNAKLEHAFPSISRIADVFSDNTVYEIQYSPMSFEEAKERTEDYSSLGLDIVWILHEDTYNNKRYKPAERFLRTTPCYYTNFNTDGVGSIYDLSPAFPVDLTQKKPLRKRKWPHHLRLRAQTWRFYHVGDQFDAAIKGLYRIKRSPKPPLFERYRSFLHCLIESWR